METKIYHRNWNITTLSHYDFPSLILLNPENTYTPFPEKYWHIKKLNFKTEKDFKYNLIRACFTDEAPDVCGGWKRFLIIELGTVPRLISKSPNSQPKILDGTWFFWLSLLQGLPGLTILFTIALGNNNSTFVVQVFFTKEVKLYWSEF